MKYLLVSLAVVTGFLVFGFRPVLADTCSRTYGGGEHCEEKTASLSIKKEVRKVADGSFDWKVEDVKKGDKVEFRITVKNVGDKDLKDVKVTDSLPSEMTTSDDTSWTIAELKSGDSKEFKIVATVRDSEFSANTTGKCVVNRATAKVNDIEISDSASVCFGGKVLGAVKLPETGPVETLVMTVTGLISALGGFALRRKTR